MLIVYRFLLPLRLVWLLVYSLYKEVYLQNSKCVSFWLHGCCGEWDGWARKPVHNTSWVAVVIPTYLPNSVPNRCVIDVFGGIFVLSLCLLDISVGISDLVCHRTEYDLFPFSLEKTSKRVGHFEHRKNKGKASDNPFAVCVGDDRAIPSFTFSVIFDVYAYYP